MSSRVGEFTAAVRSWGGRISLSVGDQAVASGANFLMNVLLVRWLNPAEYGAFGIVFSVYLLYYATSSAVIQEPLAVLGPARHASSLREYMAHTEKLHFILTAIVGVALFVAAGVDWIRAGNLTGSLVGLAIAAPTLLLYYTRRRLAYVLNRPGAAFRAAIVYACSTLGFVVIAWLAGRISGLTAFCAMGAGGLISAMYLGRALRNNSLTDTSERSDDVYTLRGVVRENFVYGKWVLGSAAVYWLATFAYQPLVGLFSGLEAAGAYRAMLNLVLPLAQVMTALGLLLLPHMSGRRASEGLGYIRKSLGRLAVLSTTVGLIYMLGLFVAGEWLIKTLYGAGYYEQFLSVALLLGGTQVVGACRQAFYIGLKAMEKPSLVFFGQAAGAAVTLSAGVWMIVRWGVVGAGWGQLVSTIVEMAVLWRLYEWYMARATSEEGA